MRSIFRSNIQAYRPVQHLGGVGGSSGSSGLQGQSDEFRQRFLEEASKKRVEEAEDVDVNAAIHGNWTMESAKSFLHGWIQQRKIKVGGGGQM